jgi:hypothetical protein
MFNLYNDQISNPDISSWANSIRKTIHDLGFAYLFNNFNDNSYCFPMMKQRLRDQFMQKWRKSLNNTSKLFFYCKFKTDFEFDNYLEVVKNITLRQQLSRFRLSSHSLEIDQGPICLQTAQAVSLHSIIYSKTTRLIIRVLTV